MIVNMIYIHDLVINNFNWAYVKRINYMLQYIKKTT